MFKKKSKEAMLSEPPAEGAAGDASAEAGGKKKPPLKLLIIAGAGGVLLLGGGGAAAFLLMPHGKDAKPPAHVAKKDKEKKGKDSKADASMGEVRDGPNGSSYYTMPDLVENMQAPDGRPTFLKLKLTFEISDPEALDLAQQESPRLHDMFTAFLRELRPDDLAGSQGTYQLKAEILRRVNLVLAPHKVDAVLIEEMLVQ